MSTTRETSGTDAPKPALSVLIRVRGALPNLRPAEQRVAEAVLADPAGVSESSITALARQCETSETTVLRFCRAIGLAGLSRPAARAGPGCAGGGGRAGVQRSGQQRHQPHRFAGRRGRQDHPRRRPSRGGHGRGAGPRRPPVGDRRGRPGLADRHLRDRGERAGRPRPAPEAAPDRPGLVRLVGGPSRPDLGRCPGPRRRGGRHLPHRHHDRHHRRPPGGSGTGCPDDRGDQLRRVADRGCRRSAAHDRGPGDHLPLRCHGQPDRPAGARGLPVRRSGPALVRRSDRGPAEHLRRGAVPARSQAR